MRYDQILLRSVKLELQILEEQDTDLHIHEVVDADSAQLRELLSTLLEKVADRISLLALREGLDTQET